MRADRWALAAAFVIVGLGPLAAGTDVLTAITGQDPYLYHNEALDPGGSPGQAARDPSHSVGP